MKAIRWALALWLCVGSVPALSQEAKQPWEEYDKLIKSKEVVTALGPDLFGDQVNLNSGALSFSATDVSIPGNSTLPVAFTRTFTVSNRKGYISDAPLAEWDLDLPRLSGVFASTWQDGRCAVTAPNLARPPGVSLAGQYFSADDYWHGNQADMPGGGEMLLVNASTPKPSAGGPYYWTTSAFTYFSCLATIKNGSGEGFQAITADGTKYWFDWMAQYVEPNLKGPYNTGSQIARRNNVLYATRVEDRFGNWVTYTYTNASNAPARLTAINANDGRQITVAYNPQGHIATVNNGTQTWAYQYSYPTSTTGTLTAVVLPDSSQWSIRFSDLSAATIRYECDGGSASCEPSRSCDDPGVVFTPGASGSITHPSGATGEFTVDPTRHGRSNVPMNCIGYSMPFNDPNDDVSYYPLSYDAFSLTKKRIVGPGLASAEWAYSYQAAIYFAPGTGPICTSGSCIEPVCISDSCAGSATTVVTGPDSQWSRYTWGNSYRYNEGKLLKVENGTGPNAILKTETTAYELAQSGMPFPTPVGTSPQPRSDGFTSEYLRPQRSNVVAQDGATFSSQVNSFDAFARPLSVGKWSSLGYSKTDSAEYYDDASKWVIGQVKRVINADNGVVMSQTDYWPATALPQRTWAFGKAQQYFVHYADGTLATVTDGRNSTTTLSSWKRGIPQAVQHHDSTSQSATVNDLGWITSVVDENGFATGYGYDAIGRLTSILLPVGDSTTWNNTTLSFAPSYSPVYGLPSGHWRQTTATGNARTVIMFDALWRPVVKETYDAANLEGTISQTVTRYDASGRTAFVSFPQRNLDPAVYNTWADSAQAPNALGTDTTYDALDRVTSLTQDSELGPLTTRIDYLAGFKRRTTSPRGFVTTESFQAFDVPSYDAPVQIDAPENVKTTIVRDGFGKPQEVTRGPGG